MVRLVVAMICALALGWAAPPLATIQDTLYKADGSRFNGFLLIECVATVPGGGGGGTPGEVTQVNEADVVELVANLAVRPVKGPGYAASRALYADATGAIQAVGGNLSDCVRVDGTAGECGGGASSGHCGDPRIQAGTQLSDAQLGERPHLGPKRRPWRARAARRRRRTDS